MSFDSRSLLRRLQELQLQIAATPQQGESLRAALDGHDLGEAICATMDAQRHVLAMAATIADILAQVVPADDLGAVESLSELVFRAVRMVVLTELSMLREVVCEASKRGKLRPLTWGRFRGIDHLTSEMRDEIHRITHQWTAYREMEGVERVTYRAALRAAHQSMRQLGNASEATRFLHEGRTRADWPALREVCSRIWVALTIRIDADPDRPLLVHEMRAIATLWLSTEPVPTEPVPTEPVPTEPVPTEPVPTEPVPTEPVPTEPVPTEPVPTEPVPTEPVPTEPVPTEPVPTEPVPTEPVPTEPVPTEPVPTEPVPTEPVPTEPVPTEPAPSSAVIEGAEAGGETTPALPPSPPPAAKPDKAGTR